MSSYSDESGRLAARHRIIDRVTRDLERAGNAGGADQRSLKWTDPQHRTMTQNQFDTFDEPILPGFGPGGRARNARDDCGNPHPFVCDDCGHSVEFGRTCSQSVCARCAVAWCRDLSTQKTAKIRRLRKEKHHHTPESEHQKIHHLVISPPLAWYYDLARDGHSLKDAQSITKSVVKDILDELRGQGLVARHSYRGADDDGSIKSESDDQGKWKERLNSGRKWWGDVRDELAWKPHFHAIVVSDYIKGGDLVERIEEETGWVIHRIADEDGVSLAHDAAMARAVTYVLSHADIQVREDASNRVAAWEVGSFEGDPIKSSSRFSPQPHDIEWADNVVRRVAADTLGLTSTTTECSATIPPVDDPDELARRIIEELYPQDDRPAHKRADPDAVLHHVSEGNISVDVSTTSGGGGDVTVRDAFGEPVDGGWAGYLPSPSSSTIGREPAATTIVVDDDQEDDDCDCGHDHGADQDDDDDGSEECDGTLVPLEVARKKGLLEDPEWCREAAHVDEAREADQEWPDDLEPWRTTHPGAAIAGPPPD